MINVFLFAVNHFCIVILKKTEPTFSITEEAAAAGTDTSVILWPQAGVSWEGLGGNSASLGEKPIV